MYDLIVKKKKRPVRKQKYQLKDYQPQPEKVVEENVAEGGYEMKISYQKTSLMCVWLRIQWSSIDFKNVVNYGRGVHSLANRIAWLMRKSSLFIVKMTQFLSQTLLLLKEWQIPRIYKPSQQLFWVSQTWDLKSKHR